MRPYTRSLDPVDYGYLQPYNTPLRAFQADMARRRILHREWCEHRFWEYASILQQLDELGVARGRQTQIIDIGSGGSFFPPYLCAVAGYPTVVLTDSMKYGDVTPIITSQNQAYGIHMPLFDIPAEDMTADARVNWMGDSDAWDVVMCISTIEHVAADQHLPALRELHRICKPGGLIFITSDYFRDLAQFEVSPSRHLQFTPYMREFVLSIPSLIGADFVPNAYGEEDLAYRGDFIHNAYSFCNVCLRKR